jgi:hypothetical protein
VTLQAAARLGAKRIWINTGTYSTEYNPDSQQNVPATLEARVAFLQAIGQEVAAMRQTNIPVRVNVFAADKLAHGEANWHYGQDELAAAVKPLAQQLQESGASLAVFDQRS